MIIKTVMCDIYGTLLTDEGTISDKTIDAIKAIRKRGILFGLCTKHDVTSVLQQLNSWKLEGNIDAIIGSDGCEIYDFTIDTKLERFLLDQVIIHQIMRQLEDLHVTFAIPHKGILYTENDNSSIYTLSQIYHMPYQVTHLQSIKHPITKIMIITNAYDIDKVLKRITAFSHLKHQITPFKNGDILLELMDKRVSKGSALEEYMSWHDYSMDELCTFGDADNDDDMTSIAGMGVIMKNGCEKCKRIADYITEDHNHDGIANFIQRFLLD